MTPPHAVDSLLGITVTASGMALTMLDILGKGKGKIERKNLGPICVSEVEAYYI